jgi:hypothetical protein
LIVTSGNQERLSPLGCNADFGFVADLAILAFLPEENANNP